MNTKTSARITPLWIIAAFVTLTETVLGYALTKVSGGVQVTLTWFVIVFALLVAGAFFTILWNRPYVFYPPSEYGSVDPTKFISALSSALPKRQLQLVAEFEKHPFDEDARFVLVDSLIEEAFRQHLVLMHEFQQQIAFTDSLGHEYVYEIGTKASGEGLLDVAEFTRQLEGTGFIELSPQGPVIKLTDLGHRFADWLSRNNRKATCFFSPLGQWGTPRSDGFVERSRKWAAQKAELAPQQSPQK